MILKSHLEKQESHMKKNNKKVVLLIVEGDSEESFLIDSLRESFEQHRIRFSVYGGDILYDLSKGKKAIKSIVGDTVKEFMLKNKFKVDDLFAVLHIIDTDGCFISKEDIVVDENQETLTLYHLESISVKSDTQKGKIAERNEQKSKNIQTMRTTNTVHSNNINYRMYYFSRNLEHILFDEMNPEKASKVLAVEQFLERSRIPMEELLKQFMDSSKETDHEANYLESWTHISEGTASLQRLTNLPLLFEFIRLNTKYE